MIYSQIEEPFQTNVEESWLTDAAQAALAHQNAPIDAELSVVVNSDEALRELNLQFRGIDAATDVLSFPSDETDPESGHPYLGDIVLSYPRALEQAQMGGHPVQAEIQLLVVHGTLHLLGHDHAEPEEKKEMWMAQAEILHRLGSPITGPVDEAGDQ